MTLDPAAFDDLPVDEEARRRFEQAWRDGTPSRIEQFLPPSDRDTYLGTLEELVQIEMELGWKGNPSPEQATALKVESYLARFPVLNRPPVVRRLVLQERRVRTRHGDRPLTAEYAQRFPNVDLGSEPQDSLLARGTDADAPVDSSGRPQIEGYQITGRLGEGGMGVVWSAIQLGTNRTVALKLMSSSRIGSASAKARFAREVELAASLEHPHIARVFESGVHEGIYFYAMERVDGLPLDEYVAGAKLTEEKILELMRLICVAVQHAHQRGVIHRDLKPSNILVDPEGNPHVLDFGLAKTLIIDPKSAISVEGEWAGTPAYMSPEQAAGDMERTDTRSDVYTLGVILFRLLTGQSPHDLTGSSMQVLQRISAGEVKRPREVAPKLNREIEALLLKSLSSDPDARYASAGAFADDLKNFLTGEPITAKAPTTTYFLRKRLRKHRVPVSVAALVILLLGSMAIVSYFRIRKARDAAQLAEGQAKQQKEFAEASDLSAQRRLADSLMSQGDAMATAGRWDVAKSRFDDARELMDRLKISSFLPEMAMTDALRHAPPELHVFGEPAGVYFGRAAFSPDGRRVYSVHYEEPIQIWDAMTGRLLGSVKGHHYTQGLVICPDGKRAITCGFVPDPALLLNLETGDVIRAFKGHDGPVEAIALSADGKRLVTSGIDKTVRLWDVETGDLLSILRGHEAEVRNVAISKDATRILSGSDDKTVKLWDLKTEQCILTIPTGEVASVAFSPSGKLALVSRNLEGAADTAAVLYDLSNGSAVRSFRGHFAGADDAAFSPDGTRILTASIDKTARLWDTATGKEIRAFTGHGASVRTAQFSPDGKMAITAADDHTARLWDLNESSEVRTLADVPDPTASPNGYVSFTCLSPDGRLLFSGGPEFPARLYDVATGMRLPLAIDHDALCAAFSPDGRSILLGAGASGDIEEWDVFTGGRFHIFHGHSEPVMGLAYVGDGSRVISASADRTVRVWDEKTTAELQKFTDHTERVAGVTSSRDGRWAASFSDNANDRTVRLWDLQKLQPAGQFAAGGMFRGAAFDPTGQIVLTAGGQRYNDATLWDISTHTPLRALQGHAWHVTGTGFWSDGTLAISTSQDGTARVWDPTTGTEKHVFGGHDGWVTSHSLSADGQRLATGSRDTAVPVRLWDFNRPAQYRALSPRVHEAFKKIAAVPDDAPARAALGEWFAFRGADQWALDLLPDPSAQEISKSSLPLARAAWRANRLDIAHQAFERAIAQKEAPQDYLRLCLRGVDLASLRSPARR